MWLNEIKNIPYSDIVNSTIQFMTLRGDTYNKMCACCCEVEELINDWWGDCDFVPENDAKLLIATLYINGKAYPIGNISTNGMTTFEVLAEALSSALRK